MDGQIPTDGRVEQRSFTTELYIKNVQPSDGGSYKCTGTGIAGSTDFPLHLIVRGTTPKHILKGFVNFVNFLNVFICLTFNN